MSRTTRFLALLAGVLALGAVVALPANPASADDCPPIPFEPTVECPGEQPPPPEEPSEGMWTPPPPADPAMPAPVNTGRDDCWFDVPTSQDIFATDTGQVAYTFTVEMSFCIERSTGQLTFFQRNAFKPVPVDNRVVVRFDPVLLQSESTPLIPVGGRAVAARFRWEITVQFTPANSPTQTYVHRLGSLVRTNPTRQTPLMEFFRTSP